MLGILRCQSDSLLSQTAWLEYVKLPSEEQFPEDRSGVPCPESGPKEVFLWGFGARTLGHAQSFSLHQKALLDRAQPGGATTHRGDITGVPAQCLSFPISQCSEKW